MAHAKGERSCDAREKGICPTADMSVSSTESAGGDVRVGDLVASETLLPVPDCGFPIHSGSLRG